jgi:3-hydroxyacyl-CoA dehydrogenase
MIESNVLGDKTKGGFYKKVGADIQTLDPATGAYRPKGGDPAIASATKTVAKIADPKKRVAALVAAEGTTGAFAWTDSVEAIDNAMKWGYGWELGPFETWDALGFATTVDRMKADGVALPAWITKMRAANADGFYKKDKVWDPQRGDYAARVLDPREATWEVMRRGNAAVIGNRGAEAWDLGDGVLGLTFKTDFNSIDDNVIKMIHETVDRAERDFRALVVFNQGENFCVGANLLAVIGAAMGKQWDTLREMIRGYQYGTQRMKYSTIPVVVAPFAGTMGGGLELCMGADAVQAAAETYAGLVEVGVGLIPGGAGTLNMLWRSLEGVPEGVEVDTYAFVTQTFKNIALAKVAMSADEAKAFGYFRATDGVSFDRARQLYEAKQRAIGLAEAGYHPPVPRAYKLPGENGIATLRMMVNTLVAGGYASAHDAKIAMKLAAVLCGGSSGGAHPVTEDQILELEREAFLSLCGEQLSLARMQFFLANKKPLRN